MVSSAIEVELDDLLQTLQRLRADHAADPEYQEWRRGFPADWPM